MPVWTLWIAALNLALFMWSLASLYVNTWGRTRLVFTRWRDGAWYMLRVNPLSLMIWWFLWIVPLAIGFRMYLRDEGLAWERPRKSTQTKCSFARSLEKARSRVLIKHVLVTGGAGFIGFHLVDALLAHGYEVTVLDALVAECTPTENATRGLARLRGPSSEADQGRPLG